MKSAHKKVRVFRVISILGILLFLTMSTRRVGARITTSSLDGGGPFPQTTLFTSIPGHPSSNVPGYPGVFFRNGSRPFYQVYGSPNGNWILAADTSYFGGSKVILVNGEAKIFENTPAPWTGNADLIWILLTKIGINDEGSWIFPVITEGPTPNGVYIISVSPSDVYSIVVQQGNPVPQIPGATWGFNLFFSVMANTGANGWIGDLTGPSPAQAKAFVFDGKLLGQMGVTIPEGQVNNNSWNDIEDEEFYVSADGNHWSVRGDLNGDNEVDQVVVVDNSVVVQEGTILPNSSYSQEVDAPIGSYMDPAGNWYVRGYNEVDGQDWVYRNGIVIAERGAPIYSGASEVFSDAISSVTFFLHVGDSFGNYIVGGLTDNPNPFADSVLVANNETVVVRQGDPIDLDNDGMFDDNAYFEVFTDDCAFLDNAGNLYFLAWIMNGSNTRIGHGVFRVDISSILPSPTVYMPFVASPE